MKTIYVKPCTEKFSLSIEATMIANQSFEHADTKQHFFFDEEESVFKKHKRDANADVTEDVDGNSWTTYKIDLWADEVED